MNGVLGLAAALAALVAFSAPAARAGDSPRTIDDRDRVVRYGNVHPRARAESDIGPTDPSLPMERVILPLLIRGEKKVALDRLLAEQQDPASPKFHRWLKPAEFGARFGASAGEIAAVSGWLRAHGILVDEVGASGTWINLTGTVADVEAVFRTEIHDYLVDGELHHANADEPSIPAALAGLVAGPVSPHDFRSAPAGRFSLPDTEMSNGAHWLCPADFATIYDVTPLLAAGLNGNGQTIAVVARTNIMADDVNSFRYFFGLPPNHLEIVVNGLDPGVIAADQLEADLDAEWSGAVAPHAEIELVVSANTAATDGVDLSAQYIVGHNLAPVMSTSFGLCESAMGAAKNTFYANLWAQAAAQGITSVVASGDAGAAGCSDPTGDSGSGPGVNGLGSTPSDVCVGGTEFMDADDPAAYWSPTNDPATLASALSYIPEGAWNESALAAGGNGLWATSGGASTVYAKPAWQAAPGVPADGVRDVPDVALTAAAKNGYLVISQRASHPDTFYGASGTSASTPAFAGVMALMVQLAGGPQGNVNPLLYGLAAAQYGAGGAAVFHDAVTGNNSVPGTSGFSCTAGYDLATGLGSVDVAALAGSWVPGGGPDFTLSGPASLTVSRGQWTQGTVGLAVSGYLLNPVSLTATGFPAGMGVVFASSELGPQGGSSTSVTVVAADSTPPGTYNLTVAGVSGSRIRTCSTQVTVTPQPLIAQATYPPPGTATLPYSFQLGATGGAGGYRWSLLECSLPPGLSLAPDGLISGTPAITGSFGLRVKVTDRTGASAASDPTILVILAGSCSGSWRWANPLPTGNTALAVTWAGTQFVAAGGSGTILTSPDGISWTLRPAPSSGYLRSVVWTGAEIVVVGDSILTSADGVEWTSHSGGGLAAAWTGHQLVVVGPGGAVATSPDGVGWTPRYSGTTSWFSGLAWTGSQVVAVGDGPVLASSDGEVWRQLTPGSVGRALAWAGTQLVAVGAGGSVATSADGISWSFPSSGTPNNLNAIAWSGTQVVAVGGTGTILTSPDGATWTPRSSGTKVSLYGVAWSGAQFVAVGGDFTGPAILTSPDGITWTPRNAGSTANLSRVRWTGNGLVALTMGAVLTSPDGRSWSSQSLGKGSSLSDVAWTGSQFVGIGTGVAMTSPDGVSWKTRANGSSSSWGGMVWTGTQLVAVGASSPAYNATVLTSRDGITWSEQFLSAFPALNAVCWTGSQLVAVGGGDFSSRPYSSLLTSPDGVTWTSHATEASRTLDDVIWTGDEVVAIGDAVLTSPDGSSWTSYPHGGSALAWTGYGFFSLDSTSAPSSSGEIFASPDGAVWTQQPTVTDKALRGIAWTGSRLVAVGDAGTILTSDCTNVCSPPAITVPPEGASVQRGRSVRLSATATGTGPLFYQWDGTTGSVNVKTEWSQDNTFVPPPLDSTAVFTVTVANTCGSVSSARITVTVTPSEPRSHLIRVQ